MGNLARAYILGTKMHYLRLQAHCKQGNPYFSPCGILNQIDWTWEGEITRVLHSFDKTGLHSYLFEERYDLPLVAFHSTAQNVLHRGPSREVLFYLSSSGHREILQADSQPRGHVRGIPIAYRWFTKFTVISAVAAAVITVQCDDPQFSDPSAWISHGVLSLTQTKYFFVTADITAAFAFLVSL